MNRTITVDGKSATIDVANGAKQFAGTDLNLTVTGFASITGDVGFDMSGSDVLAVASDVSDRHALHGHGRLPPVTCPTRSRTCRRPRRCNPSPFRA